MRSLKEKTAAGVRKTKCVPDGFLYCREADEPLGPTQLSGIPVFYSAFVCNDMVSENVEIIPMWLDLKPPAIVVERARFNEGFLDY